MYACAELFFVLTNVSNKFVFRQLWLRGGISSLSPPCVRPCAWSSQEAWSTEFYSISEQPLVLWGVRLLKAFWAQTKWFRRVLGTYSRACIKLVKQNLPVACSACKEIRTEIA